MSRKNPDDRDVDPTSITAAGKWCIHTRPEIGTGAGIVDGRSVLYRKAAENVEAFDRETARRFPGIQIVEVARSFADLAGVRQRLVDDGLYWKSQGLRVNASTLGIRPDTATVVVYEVPPDSIVRAEIAFRERYGDNTVQASSVGPFTASWNKGPRLHPRYLSQTIAEHHESVREPRPAGEEN